MLKGVDGILTSAKIELKENELYACYLWTFLLDWTGDSYEENTVLLNFLFLVCLYGVYALINCWYFSLELLFLSIES